MFYFSLRLLLFYKFLNICFAGIFKPDVCHVANGGNEAIWVRTYGDRAMFVGVEGGLKIGAVEISTKYERQIQFAETHGYTKILPGNVLEFYPEVRGYTFYVTVYYQKGVQEECPGPFRLIASAHPLEEGRSIVVDRHHAIHNVRWGNLWIDSITGKDYERDPWMPLSHQESVKRCKELHPNLKPNKSTTFEISIFLLLGLKLLHCIIVL